MSAVEIESLESGDQELCLLYIVLLLVLGVSGGAAWLSVGCRLRHTRQARVVTAAGTDLWSEHQKN